MAKKLKGGKSLEDRIAPAMIPVEGMEGHIDQAPPEDGFPEDDFASDGTHGADGVTPPHPDGYVNRFIEPLYQGVDYNEADPSHSLWTLPDGAVVDAEANTVTVNAEMVNADAPLPQGTTDNGDGTFTINSWPVSEVTANADGSTTLTVDIGLPADVSMEEGMFDDSPVPPTEAPMEPPSEPPSELPKG